MEQPDWTLLTYLKMNYFSQLELLWERCVGICTNGAASMTGKYSGSVARIREKVSNIIQTHCMIHREVLVGKNFTQSLSEVLSSCVKIVNSIKACPLQSRMFSNLYDKLGLEHLSFLFHTEVCWLSRRKIVERVFELQEEL